MADTTLEAFLGRPVRPAKETPPADIGSMVIPPEVQRERDEFAARLIENERAVAAGQPSAFPSSSAILDGTESPGVPNRNDTTLDAFLGKGQAGKAPPKETPKAPLDAAAAFAAEFFKNLGSGEKAPPKWVTVEQTTPWGATRSVTVPLAGDASEGEQSFWKSFWKHFHPKKAFEEEGIIPRLWNWMTNAPRIEREEAILRATAAVDKQVLSNPEAFTAEEVERAKAREMKRLKNQPIELSEILPALAKAAKEDPGRFTAELANAIFADPYLLLVPMGGKTLGVQTAARLAKYGETAARAGAVAGRGVGAGALGAALGTAMSGAEQLEAQGRVDPEKLVAPAAIGGALGLLAGAALTKTPRQAVDEAVLSLRGFKKQPDGTWVNEAGVKASPGAPLFRAAEEPPRPPANLEKALDEDLGIVSSVKPRIRLKPSVEQIREVYPKPRVRAKAVMEEVAPAARNTVGQAIVEFLNSPEGTAAAVVGAGALAMSTMEPEDFASLGALGLAMAGAVKAKGGMWTPASERFFTDRITDAIETQLTFLRAQRGTLLRSLSAESERDPAAAARIQADIARSDMHISQLEARVKEVKRMVTNYLNRWAGTAEDPLKDIQIPRTSDVYGQLEVNSFRWGDVIDELIEPISPTSAQAPSGARPGDRIYHLHRVLPLGGDIEPIVRDAVASLKNLLRHVGDYLSEVPLERLKNYDLARAVRETLQADARAKRAAEKASRSLLQSRLPIYKAYPDGAKWVEFKPPASLDEAMAKSVARITDPGILEQIPAEDMHRIIGGPRGVLSGVLDTPLYAGLGADGKVVIDRFSRRAALGRTPEEAWLSARMAENGNAMGNCEHCYVRRVVDGESAIFSLRAPDGTPKVSIEVTPSTAPGWPGLLPAIAQIEGKLKQPIEEKFLPYVQDFIRSGKWDSVKDIDRARMVDSEQGLRSLMPLLPENMREPISQAAARRFGGERFVSEQDWESFLNSLSGEFGIKMPWEQGFIDPRLMAAMAAAGIGAAAGAALMEDDAIRGALWGMALGGVLPWAKPVISRLSKGLDTGVGVLSTRIQNISRPIFWKMRNNERHIMQETAAAFLAGRPFIDSYQALRSKNPDLARELKKALLTGDPDRIKEVLKQTGDASLVAGWLAARAVIRNLGAQLYTAGRIDLLIDAYFPRIVKDKEGLLNALGKEVRTELEKVLAEANGKTGGRGLTELEESLLINKWLRGVHRRERKPGFAKDRVIREISDAIEPFYHDLPESYAMYVHEAVEDLARYRFFGRDIAFQVKHGKEEIDLDASIGNLLGRELREGRITPEQAQELAHLIRARFSTQVSPGWLQDVRNYTNAALLGNFRSATTQLGDLMIGGWYANGLAPTISAIIGRLTGRVNIKASDLGIQHIAEEFSSSRRSALFLNSALRYSLFRGVDFFGKDVSLNASLMRLRKWAQTSSGQDKLFKKYGDVLSTDEFKQLVDDLRSGRRTDLVDSVLFSELSDVQPISKLELPEPYLTHSHGRILYQLKSFMIKQLDIARRDGWNEIKKGDPASIARGVYNLGRLGIALGVGGMTTDAIKDFISGRAVDWDWETLGLNLLKTFGLTEYALRRAEHSVMDAMLGAGGVLVPPFRVMEDVVRLKTKAVEYIPPAGFFFYSHFLGGKEEAAERRRRKEERELMERVRGK